MTQKLKIIFSLSYILIVLSFFAYPTITNALCEAGETCGGVGAPATVECPAGQVLSPDTGTCQTVKIASECSNGVDSQDSTKCAPLGNGCKSGSGQDCLTNNPIVKDLNGIIDAISAAVALIVIGVIILGGVQYSLAGDNATQTGAAKKRIINGLIALLVFIFMFAFIQWLVPGGI